MKPITGTKGTDMNDETGRGRPRQARLLAVAVLAGTALLAAACGGDDGDKNGGPQGQTKEGRYEAALAYSKCMRENGSASFPDPSGEGAFPNDNGSLDKIRSGAGFKKAEAACQSKAPQGGPPAAQQEMMFNNLLKYSKCMREKGVPKFPDPKKEPGGGVGVQTGDEIDTNSSQYKSAQAACKALEQGGG